MHQFQQYLESVRPKIKEEVKQLGKKWLQEIQNETTINQDLISNFSWVQKTGNCLRGTLLLLGTQSYSTNLPRQTLTLAAIIELLQTALLIRDDTMDQSKYRRGGFSFPEQIKQRLVGQGQKYPEQKSLRITLAVNDHLILWIQQKLTELSTQIQSPQIIKIFNTYLTKKMCGQIADVSNQKIYLEIDTIKDLYVSKTASYTFCLPIILGQTIAKNQLMLSEEILLEVLGENLGIILQSQKDISGFNNSDQALVNLREDIQNNQASLWVSILLKNTKPDETNFIHNLYQTKIITDADLYYLRFLAQKYSLTKLVSAKIRAEAKISHQLISELEIKPALAPIWHSLVDYININHRTNP